jgi:hypothetical protein
MLLLTGAYPFNQYYIDPDATAYLTIAQRYAHGDLQRAINGYWSPWSIWLTAALIKTGIAAFKAAIMVNAIAAVGFLAVNGCLNLYWQSSWSMRFSGNLLPTSGVSSFY